MTRSGPPSRRAAVSAALVAAALACLFVVPVLPNGGTQPPALLAAPTVVELRTPSSSGCPGALQAARYPGQLVNEGGPSPGAPLGGVTVFVGDSYTVAFSPASGSNVSYSCQSDSGTATTSSSGAFTLTAPVPPTHCLRGFGCWSYTGPYGPIGFGVRGNGSLPADAFVTWRLSNGSVTIARVAALDRADLLPSGFATVSVQAPTTLSVRALAGDGSPSPANLSYAWSIAGAGWRPLSGSGGPSFTVLASAGAAIATAAVSVNGSFHGVAVSAPGVSVYLTAVATAIEQAGVVPSSVDAGVPAQFTLVGSGSAGYDYTAVVNADLGLPPISAPCSATATSVGLLSLRCSVSIRYPIGIPPAVAHPFANLSNGYSNATQSFGPVTVSPALLVVVRPDPVLVYPGEAVSFSLSVAAGTGTPPYGPACLSPGTGGTDCDKSPGSSWSFRASYPSRGSYYADLSVLDSGGTNWTRTVPVSVVDRPSLSPILLASSAVPLGRNVTALASVEGGALPLSYWWNTTQGGVAISTVDAGTMSLAGTLSTSFRPGSTGPGSIVLTIVDALGTRVGAANAFVVVPVIATAIDLAGPPNASALAGGPVTLSLRAVDGLGERVPGFTGPVSLVVSGEGSGAIWVNASASGPVGRTGNATFSVPPLGWRSGFLNLTIAAGFATTIVVGVLAAPGVVGPSPLRVSIGADWHHERLSQPHVARAGPRSNETLWRIADRFGNPIPTGYVTVRTVLAGTSYPVFFPVLPGSGASFVWVNWSVSGSGGGTVYVLSEENVTLLAPIVVPELPGTPFPYAALALLPVAAGLLALVVMLRRRGQRTIPGDRDGASEGELKRLALGRAHVLARVPSTVPVDLDWIASGWTEGPAPDPAELAEWVGALVAEGILVASLGEDERPRFARAAPSEGPPRRPIPRVEVDPDELEAALARQASEAEAERETPPPPPRADEPPS